MTGRLQLLPVMEVECDQLLLSHWVELERAAVEPNPFFAPEMVLPAARHLRGGANARLLLLGNGDRIDFLLPVTGLDGKLGNHWPVLRTWLHDYCFLGTPLVHRQADPVDVWARVLDELPGVAGTSLLMMPTTTMEGPVSRTLRMAARPPSSSSAVSCEAGVRPFARRRPEPTYLPDWMRSKSIADLGRKRRALSRRLDAELQVVNRAELDLGAAVEDFLRLEADGWKGRAQTAMLCRPGHDRFFREMVSSFASNGRLLLLSLQAGRRVLAQSSALLGGCGLFGFKKCYDEEHARSSPGVQLDVELLSWFHQRSWLDWIDSCSTPSRRRCNSIFRDYRTIGTYAVPTTRLGSGFATTASIAMRAHRHVGDMRARITRVLG